MNPFFKVKVKLHLPKYVGLLTNSVCKQWRGICLCKCWICFVEYLKDRCALLHVGLKNFCLIFVVLYLKLSKCSTLEKFMLIFLSTESECELN